MNQLRVVSSVKGECIKQSKTLINNVDLVIPFKDTITCRAKSQINLSSDVSRQTAGIQEASLRLDHGFTADSHRQVKETYGVKILRYNDASISEVGKWPALSDDAKEMVSGWKTLET